jgi:hypothetical protein
MSFFDVIQITFVNISSTRNNRSVQLILLDIKQRRRRMRALTGTGHWALYMKSADEDTSYHLRVTTVFNAVLSLHRERRSQLRIDRYKQRRFFVKQLQHTFISLLSWTYSQQWTQISVKGSQAEQHCLSGRGNRVLNKRKNAVQVRLFQFHCHPPPPLPLKLIWSRYKMRRKNWIRNATKLFLLTA